MDLQVYSPEEETNFDDVAYALEDSGVGLQDGEYTGLDDDMVDFGSSGASFASELANHKVFTTIITNGTGLVQRVSFGASMEPVPGTNQLQEGVVNGIAGLTCSGDPHSYDFFKKFIARYPARLVAMKITSTSEAQLSQSINVTRISPFEQLGSKPQSLSSSTRETNVNTRMVTLQNLNYQLDDQTDLSINIPANTTSTFTLYIGAIFNGAKALNEKATRAKRSSVVRNSRV